MVAAEFFACFGFERISSFCKTLVRMVIFYTSNDRFTSRPFHTLPLYTQSDGEYDRILRIKNMAK